MNTIGRHLSMPVSLKRFYPLFRDREFTLLDVGCGTLVPGMIHKYFPHCRYYAVDRSIDVRRPEMSGFYHKDLTRDSFDDVPDAFFDAIIMSHVIEHLPNGLDLLGRLVDKLKPGGYLYVEFPSVRSLALPHLRGTLHFCDDPTHVRIYSVAEIANLLLARDFTILKAGTRRDLPRMLAGPLLFFSEYFTKGFFTSRGTWDILGFAEYVFARRLGSSH